MPHRGSTGPAAHRSEKATRPGRRKGPRRDLTLPSRAGYPDIDRPPAIKDMTETIVERPRPAPPKRADAKRDKGNRGQGAEQPNTRQAGPARKRTRQRSASGHDRGPKASRRKGRPGR
jgi:hypothetical protein